MLSDLWQDMRYAARMFWKQPGFAAAAITTLALGIGATSAIFGVVNSVLIRPLSIPPARPSGQRVAVGAIPGQDRRQVPNLSSTMYLTYREHNQTFQEFGVWRNGMGNVTGLGDRGSPDVGGLTGLSRLWACGRRLGRWFSQADDSPGTPETVILTYGYWLQRFGGERTVIGRPITIDTRPREVIGVMPQGFRFLNSEPDVILPQRFEGEQLRPNDVHVFTGIARLKPGVTLPRPTPMCAHAPDLDGGLRDEPGGPAAARYGPALRPLKQDVVGDVGQVLWVLMGDDRYRAADGVRQRRESAAGARGRTGAGVAIRAALGARSDSDRAPLLVESLTLACWAARSAWGSPTAARACWWRSDPRTCHGCPRSRSTRWCSASHCFALVGAALRPYPDPEVRTTAALGPCKVRRPRRRA